MSDLQTARSCTCHTSEAPVPCQGKYARAAGDEIDRLRGIICWTLDAIAGGSTMAEIEKVLRDA